MAWRTVLDLLFPAQCASCNALGTALCSGCAPTGGTIRVRLPGLTVIAVGAYEDSLRTAVLALKDGRRDVAAALGELAAPLVAPGTVLVPVPTTAKRRRVRGVDGVALVARHATDVAGASVLVALHQRAGDAQRGRSRSERLAAAGRFACESARVAGRRVTLFDDVCTTGATLRDCAAAVREAGAVVEDAVVIAVAKTGPSWNVPMLN